MDRACGAVFKLSRTSLGRAFRCALVVLGLMTGMTVMPASAQSSQSILANMQPALSGPHLKLVVNWIAQDVSNSRQAYCYRQSVGRGVGNPLSTCPSYEDKDGALCYPKCFPFYKGVGPVCWQSCLTGFRDDGAFCAKPEPYGRGAGFAWQFGDGLNDNGLIQRCEAAHGRGNCEKNGLIYYPKCKAGFHAVGCCICSPNCSAGMTDIGVSCTKQSYGRGAGKPMGCAANEEKNGALCYPKCAPGFYGEGPVCWQSCPAGRKDCGAGCTTNTASCVSDTVSMVTAPLVLAVNIATFGSGSGATKSVTLGTKTAKAMEAFKKAQKVADFASKAAGVALLVKDVAMTTEQWVADYVADFENVTNARVVAEINKRFTGPSNEWIKRQYALHHLALIAQANGIMTAQTALTVVATFDPSGVAGVVDAFAKPICSMDQSFPNVTRLY